MTPTPTPDLADLPTFLRVARSHCSMLAPHQRERQGGQLLLAALAHLAPTLDALAKARNDYAELQASRDRCMELNCEQGEVLAKYRAEYVHQSLLLDAQDRLTILRQAGERLAEAVESISTLLVTHPHLISEDVLLALAAWRDVTKEAK